MKVVVPPVMEAPAGDPQVSSPKDVAELHLLISEMDDEITAYRWREAVWISIVVHVLACLGLVFVPKWIPKTAVIVPAVVPNRDNVFTLATPDNQRVKTPPRTDVMSDKNRIAQSPTPLPNKDLIRKMMEMQRPGRPVQPQPAPQPQAQQQTPAQAAPQQQAGAETAPQPEQTQQTAQLQTPAQNKGDFSPFKRTQAPGIEQAIQSVASGHGATHYTFNAVGGDYGPSRIQPNSNIKGDVEILSDTMGVDFGPYLQRVLYAIRKNWVNLIPEGAYGKKGKLTIKFAILKNGSIRGMQMVRISDDPTRTLDRAAWGGITNSNPLDPLPSDFKGEYLELGITFLYNLNLDGTEIR